MSSTEKRKAKLIATAIEERIIKRELKPGDRLPERLLAEEFGVSRTPVREAIRQLVETRLVTDNAGRGAVVARLSISELLDAFLVVAELEGLAARQAAKRMRHEQIVEAFDANAHCKKASDVKDIKTFNTMNMVFHNLIIEGSHNAMLQGQLNTARIVTFPYRHYVSSLPGYMAQSVEEHDALLNAISNSESDTAYRLMRDHVRLQGEQIEDVIHHLERQNSPTVES
jgi:DNA-binding GntR family transcriptional regulator